MKQKATLFLAIIIGLIPILTCSRFTEKFNGISNDPPKFQEDPSSFTLTGKEWKSYDLDQTDIKVDLPGAPKDQSPKASQLPPGYSEVFKAVTIHSYDEKEFGSSYTQLEPTGKRKFNIKELADTSMMALRKQLPSLKYSLDVKSDMNAKYNGSFTRNGKSFELRGCCIYQKTPERVWAVITLYPIDNADGKTAGQRIIDSVVFKGSDESCK